MIKPYYQDEWVTIYHGDCREVLPELPKVDLVLTDPPYGKDGLNSWEILGQFSTDILVDGGWCLAYSGHSFMTEILNRMASAGMIYRWMISLSHSGSHDLRPMAEMCIDIGWKPILIFRKPPLLGKMGAFNFKDTIIGSGRSKDNHKWEQAIGEAKTLMMQWDGLVVDPFMGSGTIPFAAKQLNRHCIGIEIEEHYCEVAAKRCSQSVMRLEV